MLPNYVNRALADISGEAQTPWNATYQKLQKKINKTDTYVMQLA